MVEGRSCGGNSTGLTSDTLVQVVENARTEASWHGGRASHGRGKQAKSASHCGWRCLSSEVAKESTTASLVRSSDGAGLGGEVETLRGGGDFVRLEFGKVIKDTFCTN